MKDLEHSKIRRAKVGVLEEQLQGILNERRKQAKDSDVSKLFLVLSGLSDFGTGLDTGKARKLPSNGALWAVMKAIESWAGRLIDHKHTGKDQTHGSNMISLQNQNKSTALLMGLYPANNIIHDWLGEMTPEWEKLADTLYAM